MKNDCKHPHRREGICIKCGTNAGYHTFGETMTMKTRDLIDERRHIDKGEKAKIVEEEKTYQDQQEEKEKKQQEYQEFLRLKAKYGT